MRLEKLTNEEYNVLEKIASKSKMDCWFELGEDEDGRDIVIDLEEDEILDLCEGIEQLDSGITSLDDYDLTEDEKNCYINLMYKVKIHSNLSYDRLTTLLYNALVMLEETNSCENSLMDTDLADEVGITEDEYDFLMERKK